MNLRNILAIIGKELIHLRRTPVTVGLVLFLPIISISIVNFGFGEVKGVPLIVSDRDGSSKSQMIVDAFHGLDTFKIVLEGNLTDADARNLVTNGIAKVAVIIPRGTGQVISRNEKANITVLVDATDRNVYLNIRRGLGEALRDASKALLDERIKEEGSRAKAQPIDFAFDFVYGQELRIVEIMTPFVIAFMQSYVSLSLTSMSIMKEKLGRTLERILVAPVRGSEILLGKLFAALLVTIVAVIILLAIAFSIFKIQMFGSLWDVFWLGLLISLGGLGLGLTTSAIAKREVEVTMANVANITVSLLLSGFIWPIESLSPTLRFFTYLIPLRYANHALRSIMLSGLGLDAILPDIIALGIFGAGTLVAGTLMFRRELVAES